MNCSVHATNAVGAALLRVLRIEAGLRLLPDVS